MALLKRDDASISPASSDLNAMLGRGSEFEGKLTFEGTVRIDGKFTGSIVTADVLVIGEGAKVTADITCGSIVVHGEVTGNVQAKESIELRQPAKLRGNIETPSLMIERGARFEGQTTMDVVKAADKAMPGKFQNVNFEERTTSSPPVLAASQG
jgi:cytoskeletal protein CcmA (bactofilin family)